MIIIGDDICESELIIGSIIADRVKSGVLSDCVRETPVRFSPFGTFSVAIIPYTYENTRFGEYGPGSRVNLEFDMIGKYVARLLKGYES